MFKIFAVSLIVFLTGAGCLPAAIPQDQLSGKAASSMPTWQNIGPGISRYECGAEACGARLILYRFSKDEFIWHFNNSAEPMTVEAWAASMPKAIFVANGVYFDEKFQPTGMLKTSGVAVNGRTYDLKESALLELSPAIAIIDTAAGKPDLAKISEAAQSYPLLIKNGVAAAIAKDEHPARRTIVGTDKNGDVYAGVIPEDSVSFAELVSLLERTNVKWNNVLNLDGGTSTGFSIQADGYDETMNSIVQVPNVIVAERK
jgi:uncharacterized protein YigE (DUF2233 family)